MIGSNSPRWPLWAILGAALGFVGGRGTVDIHDGPTEDVRILRVVVLGFTVHTEEGSNDSIWPRGRIWGATTLATLIVAGAAAAVALRAIVFRATSPRPPGDPGPSEAGHDEPAARSPAAQGSILENLQALIGVTVIGVLIVIVDEAALGLLFPEFRPELPYAALPIVIPPLAAVGLLGLGQRQHPLAKIVRWILQGVILTFLLAGAIAALTFALAIMG
jgi:hypothetical protein